MHWCGCFGSRVDECYVITLLTKLYRGALRRDPSGLRATCPVLRWKSQGRVCFWSMKGKTMTATQEAETVEAKPFGRPSDYDPKFCDEVIRLGEAGYSKAEITAHFGVSKQTLYNWADRHPDFLEALKQADVAAQGWWERQAREGLVDGKINANLFKIIAYNRWRDDYADRKEVKIDANHQVHHSVLQALAAPQVIEGEVIDGDEDGFTPIEDKTDD